MTERPALAIVGMAGRFPGAANPGQLWPIIRDGIEAIRKIPVAEHTLGGLLDRRDYVPAAGLLDGIDRFDADFFGITPSEARLIDPQHRMLLECSWQALEDAACVPDRFHGQIGVFAGVSPSTYHQTVTDHSAPGTGRPLGLNHSDDVARAIASDTDFAATRVAHRLNLHGPAMSVQTACSTSLVAVHLAARSLQVGDCDAALAGGAAIRLPNPIGYLYRPGGILSPDGHCRPFSARAQGTVPGSGCGVVLLKRLADAITAGDHVHAVIIGSAINNDGAVKLSFAAPSVAGQTAALTSAVADAGIDPATIGYLEAHGTGTPLGDRIEIAAATAAFTATATRQVGCVLGSLKANIGHLDTAAGIAGLIKTVLVLRHGIRPPVVHPDEPNPDLDSSPFRLLAHAERWPAADTPHRAAVSSFGIGGTNAHVVLQQAPEPPPARPARPYQLLLLSARTGAALERRTADLAGAVRDVVLPVSASTLLTGRAEFAYRRARVAATVEEAHHQLRSPAPGTHALARAPRLAFLFPGFGAQRAGLTTEIYENEPVFRDAIDQCADSLAPVLGVDLRLLLNPDPDTMGHATRALRGTTLGMPALVAIEYALTRLLASWGVTPSVLLGHSLGEWTAACVAGVSNLDDGLRVAAARGRLADTLPAGAMLAVSLAAADVGNLLTPAIGVSADLGPGHCVVSGPAADIADLAATLTDRDITHQPLPIDRALHSPAIDRITDQYRAALADVVPAAPSVPILSNVSGTWLTENDAIDPGYWARQLRATCRIAGCLETLATAPAEVLLHVGPGRTLSTWARRHPATSRDRHCLPTLTGPDATHSPYRHLLAAVGRLWEIGVSVDLAELDHHHRQPRTTLPTYPFEPTRHWLTDPPAARVTGDSSGPAATPAQPATDALARIWAATFGVDHVRDDDNFFALGGDSLLALRLTAAIRRELGYQSTPRDLMETPILRDFRDRLSSADGQADARPSLAVIPVPDRTPGPLPPLYLVHPVGGGTLVYRELASALADTCPVLGFTARGFDDLRSTPRNDVNDMAHAYVDELLADRPSGPYWLGGSSFGGVVAYVMAGILRARGRAPLLLALLDSPWPTPTIPTLMPPPGASAAIRGLYRAHHQALRTTTLDTRTPPCPTVYIRAADEPHSDPNSWHAAVPNLARLVSLGTHDSMLHHPHADHLAKLLIHQLTHTLESPDSASDQPRDE